MSKTYLGDGAYAEIETASDPHHLEWHQAPPTARVGDCEYAP